MADFFASPAWLETMKVFKAVVVTDIWETLYSTVLATGLAFVIGLPLGVLLVVGEADGVRPLPGWLMKALNFLVNLLRSVPFLILMIMVLPLSGFIVGTQIGTIASIIPLTIAAFPFIARLVESSLRETDKGVIEAAQSMGSTPFQIIWKVMLPEAKPSLISGLTIALTTIMGYGAMAGIIGGGGLGRTAINYGYYRKMPLVMYIFVILLVILVQIFQSIGTRMTVKSDKRINQTKIRRRK